MADSIYKRWEEKIDGLTSGDFKEGVIKAIRQLKEEVYNLQVDQYNQSMGRIIRDDKRIVLSAPEIIIGDVNLGGMLRPGSGSKVIVKGADVSLHGVGDMGKIDMRAPVVSQIAENPGIDGNEHIIGDASRLVAQAASITIQSDSVEKDGAFPPAMASAEGGIRIRSDRQIDVQATLGFESLKRQIEALIKKQEDLQQHLQQNVEMLKDEFNEQRKEIDDLLDQKSKLAKDDLSIRTDYQDMDSLNTRIEELSTTLTDTIFKYSNALSLLGESKRLLKYFKARKDEVAKTTADDFKKKSTGTAVNIIGERLNLASMDGDHQVRTNAEAGVGVLAYTMDIRGNNDPKGSLPEGNRLSVNMRDVAITTSGTADVETDDQDVLTKASYVAEGDVVIRSKNITLESVDYEVAEKKYKEKGLTAEGKILLRSKTIEASTVNAKDVDVDDKGKLTKATYTSEGDVIVNSKTFAVKAVDSQLDGSETKETALTKDGSVSFRTERGQFMATDTEGKATGSLTVNAKAIDVKAMDVDKEKFTDSQLAEGGTMTLVAQQMFAGAKSKDVKSKKLQLQSEEIGLFADKTLEAQQGEAKGLLQLADGKAVVSGSETQLYGKTTVNAETEVKGELKAPKATIDNLEAKTSLKTPNISDGMAVGAPGAAGSASAKLKAEDAPKE